MNATETLLQLASNPQYLTLTGSRLYGTHTETSDEDYRGFFIPPWQYVIKGRHNQHNGEVELAKPPEGDHKVYFLETFVKGLIKGDAQFLEILFAPPSHQEYLTPLSDDLLANRHRFVSKMFYWRICGFANSEFRKARGVKVIIPDRTKSEDDVVMGIRNVFSPDKADMDQIIALLNKNKRYKEVPSLQGMGEKRQNEFHQYGYTASSACHSLRLLYQCREMLETGTMTFPRPERDVLRSVKRGLLTLPEIEERYAEAKAKCDEAFEKSTLPDKPDSDWAMDWYEQQIAEVLRFDARMKNRALNGL